MGRMWNPGARNRPVRGISVLGSAALALTLSSCALDAPSNLNIKVPDMTSTASNAHYSGLSGQFFSLSQGTQALYNPPGFSTPTSPYNFTCYGIAVTAPDLPSICNGSNSGGSPYFGGLVANTGGSISLQVPEGPSRKIKLFGIMSNTSPSCQSVADIMRAGASQAMPLDAQSSTQASTQGFMGVSSLSEPYDLGTKIVDLYTDSTVSITPVLNTASPTSLFSNCSSSVFSPATPTGLSLWLRGDSIPQGTANNASVSSWPDNSSNNYSGTLASVTADGSSLTGGKYSYVFSATSYAQFPGNSALAGAQNRVISTVVYFAGGAAGVIYSEKFSTGASTASDHLLNLKLNSGMPTAEVIDSGGTSNIMSWGTVPASGWHILTMIWTNTSLNICVDGSCAAGVAVGSPPNPTTAVASYVGAQYSASSLTGYFSGKVAELAVYNTAVSQTDVSKLECYLKGKYPNDLPALGHAC